MLLPIYNCSFFCRLRRITPSRKRSNHAYHPETKKTTEKYLTLQKLGRNKVPKKFWANKQLSKEGSKSIRAAGTNMKKMRVKIIEVIARLQKNFWYEPQATATDKQVSTKGSHKKTDFHPSSRRKNGWQSNYSITQRNWAESP